VEEPSTGGGAQESDSVGPVRSVVFRTQHTFVKHEVLVPQYGTVRSLPLDKQLLCRYTRILLVKLELSICISHSSSYVWQTASAKGESLPLSNPLRILLLRCTKQDM